VDPSCAEFAGVVAEFASFCGAAQATSPRTITSASRNASAFFIIFPPFFDILVAK